MFMEVNVSLYLENAADTQQTVTVFKSILTELFAAQLLSEVLNDSDTLLKSLLSLEEHDFLIARDSFVVIEVRKYNE